MRYISIWLFISFALGIILGKFLSLNFFFLIFLAIFSLLASILFYKKHKLLSSDIFILFLFFFLGLIWIKPYTVVLPEGFLNKEVNVYGKIDTPPKYSYNFKTYSLRPNYIIHKNKKIYFADSIFVKDYSKVDISYLDYYIFKGKLKRYPYRRAKYVLYIRSKSPPSKVRKSFGIKKLAFLVSEKLSEIFKNNFSPDISSFILSIFLGRRENLPKQIKKIFIDAGTSHILAISGLHIGIVAGIILLVLKFFNLKMKSRFIIAIPLVLSYAFICGLRAPVFRAAIIFFCFSLSFLMRRKFLVFNSLALAGLINLFLRPNDLFNISFQFSFIAVFFIALGFRYFYKKRKLCFLEKIRILFFMSLFANLGLLPLISFYFGKIYIFNIFANLVVIPYLGLIFSSLFVFLGLYFVVFLREIFIASCSVLIILFLKINYFFAELPFSYFEYRFSLLGIFLYYFTLFALAFLIKFYYQRIIKFFKRLGHSPKNKVTLRNSKFKIKN